MNFSLLVGAKTTGKLRKIEPQNRRVEDEVRESLRYIRADDAVHISDSQRCDQASQPGNPPGTKANHEGGYAQKDCHAI